MYNRYRLKFKEGLWSVYDGHIEYGNYLEDSIVFSSPSIADCYAWVKAKEEGLILYF
jgi:hypothetical protein